MSLPDAFCPGDVPERAGFGEKLSVTDIYLVFLPESVYGGRY